MGSLIRETFRAMVQSLEPRLNGTGLILSQWLTLRLIGRGVIPCVGDVSRELGIESGASTRLVDQLELRGLLTRKRSDTDRRVVGIVITAEGSDVLASTQPMLVEFWTYHLAIFDAHEQDFLIHALMRLRDSLLTR